MLFLMNDAVFQLDGVVMDPRVSGEQLRSLQFPAIIRMGQEMFAKTPLLQRRNPEPARRLGVLIAAKAPLINAAQFLAPTAGCEPHEVTVRFASAQFEVMADLYTLQRAGELDAPGVDSRVWRRLAA